MKGDLSLKILEAVKETSLAIGDLCYIFTLPYGTSVSRMIRETEKRRSRRGSFSTDIDLQKRRQFSAVLHNLKKDGLVSRKDSRGESYVSITKKGLMVLNRLMERKRNFMPSAAGYRKSGDTSFKIVVFDIPEKYRRKRDWLREVLRNLGFTMIQKSVWAGKVGLPEDFLKDLEATNIIDYVEIFSVSKSGTLRKME